MPYKKKIRILIISAALLALVYSLTLFFDPDRVNARNASFTWLPRGARDEADRIEIIHGDEKLDLVFTNGAWYALLDTLEIPVKQGRVDDLFRLLGTRGAFPRRGSSAASHGELGLGNDAARLVIRGPGIPLLDVLVGNDDPSGKEVFLRKTGENEFRSGDKLIASYVKGGRSSWYDLKLFEEKSPDLVQRVRVNFTGPEGITTYGIVRSGEAWILDGASIPLDRDTVEIWIRGILEAQGEDIVLPGSFGEAGAFTGAETADGGEAPALSPSGSITVELGDGSSLSLQIDAAGEDGKSPAAVTGKPYLFILPQWTVSRLLQDITR
jgi:hypothetical protein